VTNHKNLGDYTLTGVLEAIWAFTKMSRMKRGLFRTTDSYLGECARVHEDAGDAFPYLRREIYEALGFAPPYDELPIVAPVAQTGRQSIAA
jgi:hypothetical protein